MLEDRINDQLIYYYQASRLGMYLGEYGSEQELRANLAPGKYNIDCFSKNGRLVQTIEWDNNVQTRTESRDTNTGS